jgi:hypothetical protein
VLEGENLGYKRMGLSALLVLTGGAFTWLALFLGTGIAGVAVAALATSLMTGLLFLKVTRAYAPWFGVSRPSFEATRHFLSLSGWFLAWNLIMRMMLATSSGNFVRPVELVNQSPPHKIRARYAYHALT